MATPIVAGVSALWLDANFTLSTHDLSALLRCAASRDRLTWTTEPLHTGNGLNTNCSGPLAGRHPPFASLSLDAVCSPNLLIQAISSTPELLVTTPCVDNAEWAFVGKDPSNRGCGYVAGDLSGRCSRTGGDRGADEMIPATT